MASLSKISESDKKLARKVGKLPAVPAKPPKGAPLSQLESYVKRWNDYCKKVKEMAAKARKRETLAKSIHG